MSAGDIAYCDQFLSDLDGGEIRIVGANSIPIRTEIHQYDYRGKSNGPIVLNDTLAGFLGRALSGYRGARTSHNAGFLREWIDKAKVNNLIAYDGIGRRAKELQGENEGLKRGMKLIKEQMNLMFTECPRCHYSKGGESSVVESR